MEPLVQQATPDPVEQALGDGHHESSLLETKFLGQFFYSKYGTLSRACHNLPPTLSAEFLACQE